jgi:hypothetical protein
LRVVMCCVLLCLINIAHAALDLFVRCKERVRQDQSEKTIPPKERKEELHDQVETSKVKTNPTSRATQCHACCK